MNNVIHIPKPNELQEFMDFLFNGLSGYMYVVAKVPDDPDSWDQVFFEYPEQVPTAVKAINTYSKTHEIYLAPALYKNKNATRESVKITNVLWCDFDGNTPSEFDIPPSLIIRSSEPGHEHVYWKMDSPLSELQQIEDYNRRLAFKYGADLSGWDATQVLRPPYTVNHKRSGAAVATLHRDENLTYNLAVFDTLAPAPEKTVDYALWERIDLPSLNDVLYQNKFGPDFKQVFEKPAEEVADRSSSLTNLAYICAEAGLNDKEIYVVLSHTANRWGKFKHHSPSSRARQFIGIIEHTRIKYPNSNFSPLEEVFEYSPLTLLQADIKIEWAIPDMLIKNGVMLVAGEGGIGKSRWSLQVMFHLAAGKPFLHYKIEKPQKIGFFSLEMGQMELKVMMEQMYPYLLEAFSDEERRIMNENLVLLPFGESIGLNTEAGQNIMLQYINSHEWDGIFIDSVGSAVLGSINDGANVQNLTNFNDRIRNRYNIFLWYIHHMRKQPPGGKGFGGGDDVYGDVYLTNRATNVYTLIRKGDDIRVRNTKSRLAPEEEPFLVHLNKPHSYFTSKGTDAGDPEKVVANINETNSPVDQSPKPFFG